MFQKVVVDQKFRVLGRKKKRHEIFGNKLIFNAVLELVPAWG